MNNHPFFKLLLIILTVSLTSCIISNYDQPCSISGRVTDTSGKGIADVIITPNEAPSRETTKTASDGSYKIDFTTGGTVNLAFSKVGYTGKTSDFVLLGGEKKVLDVKLNTLSEDAYFKVATKEKMILNTGESFSPGINTNVSYEYESNAPWITCVKYGSDLSIKCDSNETLVERNAIIILRAEYNHNDTIKIKQLAGPILRVLDYIGKNNTSFPQTTPFVTFSREVTVLSATGSSVNLPYELSADKKTVSFSNIKLNAFSTMPIQLSVKASDGIQLSFDFNLKLFINSTPFVGINGQEMYFTNDDKFIWILSYNGNQQLLTQFSTTDFTKRTQISGADAVFYNPYNNCLYEISQRYFEDRYVFDANLYDAATGNFKEKFTIDNRDGIRSMAFSNNGLGLMICGSQLYSIDSSNKHKIQLIDSSNLNGITPYRIEMCDDNKTFILYCPRNGTEVHVFTMDSDTKSFQKIYFMSDYIQFKVYKLITSNSTKNILYYSPYRTDIAFQDSQTKNIKTMTLAKDVNNAALLVSSNTLPYVLTSDLSLISVSDNSVRDFTDLRTIPYLKSSNNAKLVCITYGDNLYLFKSEVFTNYSNFIK
jgi:hypothetical protein